MAKAKTQVYRRSDGQFDWRIIAGNGFTLGGSSQGYTERNDAVEGLGLAIEAICNDILEVGRFTQEAKTIIEVELVDKATPSSEKAVALSVEFTEPIDDEPETDPMQT